MSKCTIMLPAPLPFAPMPLPGPTVLNQNLFLVGSYLWMGLEEMAGWRSSVVLVQKDLGQTYFFFQTGLVVLSIVSTLWGPVTQFRLRHGHILQMKKLRLREVLSDALWCSLAFSVPAIQSPSPAIQEAFLCIFYKRQISFIKKKSFAIAHVIICSWVCHQGQERILPSDSRNIFFHCGWALFLSKLTAAPQACHAFSGSYLCFQCGPLSLYLCLHPTSCLLFTPHQDAFFHVLWLGSMPLKWAPKPLCLTWAPWKQPLRQTWVQGLSWGSSD